MRDTAWFKEWWWVFCFTTIALSLYFHSIQDKKAKKLALLTKIGEMRHDWQAEIQTREMLKRTIASQSDPSWIEMVLMRDLGVVPEGWIKVHFTK